MAFPFQQIVSWLSRKQHEPHWAESSENGLSFHNLTSLPDLFSLRGKERTADLAAIVHIYYEELTDELLERLGNIKRAFDLFVSLVEGKSDHLFQKILDIYPSAQIFVFPNLGRDILPFLCYIKSGALWDYKAIIKIHSKSSIYMSDGSKWRRDLLDGVLPEGDATEKLFQAFIDQSDIGILCHSSQIYAGEDRWVGNRPILEYLLPVLSYSFDEAASLPFAGGAMFWIKPLILRDIMRLDISSRNFEMEPIPIDGALPHALERIFSLCCYSAGMRIEASDELLKSVATREDDRAPHLIAFYLPQYHPIPENDRFWGKGFTEWTNVTAARPLFRGHRQPRLPTELGFVDLRLKEARVQQASLADQYGIHAFCYYFYWFGKDRTLLEAPIRNLLESKEPEFPFLICWANEPWSRSWDGLAREVLVEQPYEEGWERHFALCVSPFMRDPRYYRMRDGRPLLLIYRVMNIPEPAEAIASLREQLRIQVGEVHIGAALVRIGDDKDLPDDPTCLNLDSYYGFPPHRLPQLEKPGHKPVNFTGNIYRYRDVVDREVGASLQRMRSDLFAGVMMGFDNSPRRANGALIFHGATPTRFRRWLRHLVLQEARCRDDDADSIIFVNAWNEWGEGTYLEPDTEFGRGWLEAIKSALGA